MGMVAVAPSAAFAVAVPKPATITSGFVVTSSLANSGRRSGCPSAGYPNLDGRKDQGRRQTGGLPDRLQRYGSRPHEAVRKEDKQAGKGQAEGQGSGSGKNQSQIETEGAPRRQKARAACTMTTVYWDDGIRQAILEKRHSYYDG